MILIMMNPLLKGRKTRISRWYLVFTKWLEKPKRKKVYQSGRASWRVDILEILMLTKNRKGCIKDLGMEKYKKKRV